MFGGQFDVRAIRIRLSRQTRSNPGCANLVIWIPPNYLIRVKRPFRIADRDDARPSPHISDDRLLLLFLKREQGQCYASYALVRHNALDLFSADGSVWLSGRLAYCNVVSFGWSVNIIRTYINQIG
jgi:hypothetical protein